MSTENRQGGCMCENRKCGDKNGDNVCDLEQGHYGKHMQSWKGGTMVWGFYKQRPENGQELRDE